MDIKEACELRKTLERDLLSKVNEFENKTGLVIERIDLQHGERFGEKPKVEVVQMKVAL